MRRVLLITWIGLIVSVSAGLASPFEALDLNVISGMQSDGQPGDSAAIMMTEVRTVLPNSAWRSGLGVGTTVKGGNQLTLNPIWRASLQYRLDVVEIIPYGSLGLMGRFTDTHHYRTLCALGLERVYQAGWLTFLEVNASVPLSSNPQVGGVILLGLGYQYTLNALY